MSKPWSKQRALQTRIELLESILTDEQKQYLHKLKQQQFTEQMEQLSKALEETV